MPDVNSLLADDNRNIRHHGLQIMAIADYSATVPTSFFAPDGTLLALPTGYMNMGYITTAGIKIGTAITETTDTMVQDIEPVRTSLSALTRTLVVSFGESNAWTQSLAAAQPVSAWPSDKNASYTNDFGQGNDFPYYRLLILTQDYSGSAAVYRVEFAYRAKVTALADRTLDRTNVEEISPTFTCFRDPVVGKSYTIESTASTGPVGVPAITSVLPSGQGTGQTVTITGTGFTGVTASQVKFGATAATSITVTGDTSISAVLPSGSAGSAPVTVTNTQGTSTAAPYTRAA